MFTLPKLPYAYNALEPYIDARTMEIHYTKHHNAYTTNLNTALAPAGVEGKTIEEILTSLDMNNAALRNNAGGFYNHNWLRQLKRLSEVLKLLKNFLARLRLLVLALVGRGFVYTKEVSLRFALLQTKITR